MTVREFINCNRVIGRGVRIDSFCVMTCKRLVLGDYVHIGPHCSISGPGEVHIGDCSTLSHGVRIFTASDDFSGEWMTGPTLPEGYAKPEVGNIYIGKGCVIGANSVLIPGARIEDYSSVGALSLLKYPVPPFEIWAGCPARCIRRRLTRVWELHRKLEEQHGIP